MNYYIIPKNNFIIKPKLELTYKHKNEPFISHSIFYFLNELKLLISNMKQTNNSTEIINNINKIINPFEFIHLNVPGTSLSVSKLKSDSCIFYELLELIELFNIFDNINLNPKLNIGIISNNHTSINYLLNMVRENNNDILHNFDFDFNKLYRTFFTDTDTDNYPDTKYDLFIIDVEINDDNNINDYCKHFLISLIIILKQLNINCDAIIKINDIIYKPILDILFILSKVFDKVCLIKPIISNITSNERYLICKSFVSLEQQELTNLINLLSIIISVVEELHINVKSILDNDLSCYFINKIEESNVIIGQQQIEAHDQIINIFKNKNRDDKIENLKRIHIQKCIQWCDKYQLPHNKFIDKINIFLMPKKEDDNL